MPRVAITLIFVAALAVACGGRERESPSDVAPSANSEPAVESDATTSPESTKSESPVHARPLSSAEQARLRSIAKGIDDAIELFDMTYRDCPPATWSSCVDRAWKILHATTTLPQYQYYGEYHFDARTRGCEPLAVAVNSANSFVLGAQQVLYGDPAEVGTSNQRSSYLALVDGLRPVPSELREAATSGCR